MTKFRHTLETIDETDHLRLGGVLDEDCELERLANDLESNLVEVDLADVERINSGGAEAWWAFVASVAAKEAALVLARCSAAMVAQLNRAMTGDFEVRSFAMPYFCPECDEPRTLYVDATELRGPPYEAPVRRCERCDLVMQFDDEPAYFSFLTGTLTTRPVAEVDAAAPEAIAPANPERSVTPLFVAVFAVVLLAVIATVALMAAG